MRQNAPLLASKNEGILETYLVNFRKIKRLIFAARSQISKSIAVIFQRNNS